MAITVVTWAWLRRDETGLVDSLAHAVPMLAVAVATLFVPVSKRRAASTTAAISLLFGAALLIHLSSGLPELHILFFIIIGVVTLYQQWAPYLAAVAFVVLHHGVIAPLMPEHTYSNPTAFDRWWQWAAIHGVFILIASGAGLTAWKFDEVVRAQLRDTGEQHRAVLSAVADAVFTVDATGHVAAANKQARQLLARVGIRLSNRHIHHLLHPLADHAPEQCPFGGVRGSVFGSDAVTGPFGTVPVRFTVAVTSSDGRGQALLTLTDASGDQRVKAAEERVRHISAAWGAERDQVTQLISSVLPRPLDRGDVDLVAAYRPAVNNLVGGDLYDWFTRPDERIQVTVIDALGKGVAATNQAISVMHALRVLSMRDEPLEQLFASADAALTGYDPDLLATAAVARYCPRSGDVELVTAGHPPALLVRADGSCAYVECVGIGFGVPGAGTITSAHVRLEPGDSLVLYTDGMIEGTRDLDQGMYDLAYAASGRAHLLAADMVDGIIEHAQSGSSDDDRVVVVLRRTFGDRLDRVRWIG